jgi:hypothetical protein
MPPVDYMAIAVNALQKLKGLHADREAVNIEIVKLEQFISATANLLPDSERRLVNDTMESFQELSNLRETGLTDAIRAVLKSAAGQWLTVANVRDRLVSAGFDFSAYTANPLASISTTLRRMKSEDMETGNTDGSVITYRWKGEKFVPLNSLASFWIPRSGPTILTAEAKSAAKATLMSKVKK